MSKEISNQEKNISDKVLAKVTQLVELNLLNLPKDYSLPNALKSAWLILPDVLDMNKKQALSVCTPESIATALYDMSVQGLSPAKKQGYFLVYGTQLKWQRSYFGSIALAKRYGGLKRIIANVIYEKDVFRYEINKDTGLTTVLEHTQAIENIDSAKIRGAYATALLDDGTTFVTIMNIMQIKASWNMGKANGNSPAHSNFTDEMCKKTVLNRACKLLINTSDDSALVTDNDLGIDRELSAEENKTDIAFTEHEDVTMNTMPPPEEQGEIKTQTPTPKADIKQESAKNTGAPQPSF